MSDLDVLLFDLKRIALGITGRKESGFLPSERKIYQPLMDWELARIALDRYEKKANKEEK